MVIRAKYEKGVFKPLEKVSLKEGTIAEVYVPSNSGARPAIELLEGLWADRDDILDGITYVDRLRDIRRM